MKLSLESPLEVQQTFARFLHTARKNAKLSRRELALHSGVPASTIKRFELNSEISLAQFILLWQALDQLGRLSGLCNAKPTLPTSIDEVLKHD